MPSAYRPVLSWCPSDRVAFLLALHLHPALLTELKLHWPFYWVAHNQNLSPLERACKIKCKAWINPTILLISFCLLFSLFAPWDCKLPEKIIIFVFGWMAAVYTYFSRLCFFLSSQILSLCNEWQSYFNFRTFNLLERENLTFFLLSTFKHGNIQFEPTWINRDRLSVSWEGRQLLSQPASQGAERVEPVPTSSCRCLVHPANSPAAGWVHTLLPLTDSLQTITFPFRLWE